MKKFINFIVNWIKKQSASVLISIALHVLIAIIASIFIVFNIEPQKEKNLNHLRQLSDQNEAQKPRVKMKKKQVSLDCHKELLLKLW